MKSTEHGLVKRTYERIASWLTVDDDDLDDVDEEYVTRSAQFERYWYINVVDQADSQALRCNLCAQLFPVEASPAAFEHVAGHHGAGDASVDPFAHGLEHHPRDLHGAKVERRPRTSMAPGEHRRIEQSESEVWSDETYAWIKEEQLTADDLLEMGEETIAGPDLWTEDEVQTLSDEKLPADFYSGGAN